MDFSTTYKICEEENVFSEEKYIWNGSKHFITVVWLTLNTPLISNKNKTNPWQIHVYELFNNLKEVLA